jgi:hypothetical protein
MKKEEFERKTIMIHIDENGHIIWATNLDGSPLQYHSEEPKELHNTKTRLLTPNDCCWRNTPTGMRCSPAYCK